VQAFQIHAVDYLLKPVEPARLQQALRRARERLRDRPRRLAVNTRVAVAARPPGQWLERIAIREGTHVHVLGTHTLDFIEAQDDYLVSLRAPNVSQQQTARAAGSAAGSPPIRAYPPLFHDQCGAPLRASSLMQG